MNSLGIVTSTLLCQFLSKRAFRLLDCNYRWLQGFLEYRWTTYMRARLFHLLPQHLRVAQLSGKDALAWAGAVGRAAMKERAGAWGTRLPSADAGAQGPLIRATFPPQKDARCLEAKPHCFIVASASTVEGSHVVMRSEIDVIYDKSSVLI